MKQKLPAERRAARASVVLFRAGEVEERRTERPGRDDAQVDLEAALDDDRALCVAARENPLDGRRPGEHLEDRCGIVARDDDVDIADRFLGAAEAAGDRE